MRRGSNYELVAFLGCKPSANYLIWHSSLNLNLFADLRRSFSSTLSECDLLNISVVGGNSFCSTVTVCDHFPRIVFSLENKKCLEDKRMNKYL